MVHVSTFRFNNFFENTYIVFDDTGQCMIVDPGMYTTAEREAVDDYISFLGLQIQYVVLTHAHIDHILGLSYIMHRYRVPLIIHESEYRNLELLRNYGKTLGYELDKAGNDTIFADTGSQVAVGNMLFSVLLTPGHTQHSISLYNEAAACIFSGDVLYANAIGNTSLPGGNLAQLIDTLREKILTLPANTVFYPGHGPVGSIGYVQQSLKDGYFNNFKPLPLL